MKTRTYSLNVNGTDYRIEHVMAGKMWQTYVNGFLKMGGGIERLTMPSKKEMMANISKHDYTHNYGKNN